MIRDDLAKAFIILLAPALMLSWPNAVACQDVGTAPPLSSQSQPSPTKMTAVPVQIAPGDLLEISVFDVPEMTQQVRVGSDGKVQLALLGSTSLAGLTGQQAAEMIARELHDRNLLVRPQVNVLIKESTTQGVSVLGEVQRPGIYQVLGPRTVLDMISMAGGLTNLADTRITIKHRSEAENSVTFSLKNDDPKTSLATDVQVFPGDLVIVPRAGIVYVLGDVARPGGFVMQDSGKITLLQALAQAGSVLTTAAANHAVLLRKSDKGYVSSKPHVDKIARGQEPDFELHANDILFIPSSRVKSAVRNTTSIASSIGTASIYAIIHP
jgi:polysaccharide export outer membrane protein